MCGIFGYITKNGRGPDLGILEEIALVTETRGQDAFGLAWVAGDTIAVRKSRGAAREHLDDLRPCRRSPVVIGHCRLATHGDPADNRNNHPHRCGTGWFVHNGVVRNYWSLGLRYRERLTSDCDSEVLGFLIAGRKGRLAVRAARAVEMAEGPLALLGCWLDPVRLLVVRNGNPLCFSEGRNGWYFASLPGGLPGTVYEIKDRHAGVFLYRDGQVTLDLEAILQREWHRRPAPRPGVMRRYVDRGWIAPAERETQTTLF